MSRVRMVKGLLDELGAWFERGAWRFPTVAAKEEFERRLELQQPRLGAVL